MKKVPFWFSVDELRAIRQALSVRRQTVIGACVDEETLCALERNVDAAIFLMTPPEDKATKYPSDWSR